MGQRLVVTIEKNEKAIAKIYYHWSAYTYSALLETKKVINCIYNHKDESEKEMLLRLIRFCEDNGGGIKGDTEEFEYIKNIYPNEIFKTENYSRNEGLIALSEKGMADLQRWSEGDVNINLDDDSVEFGVYCGYENLEEYNEERMEWDDEFEGLTLEEIPYIDCQLGYFDASDIHSIVSAFQDIGCNDFVIRTNDEICELTC